MHSKKILVYIGLAIFISFILLFIFGLKKDSCSTRIL